MPPTPEAPARLPHELEAGAVVGRYRVEGVMGRGGMGTVYRAFDPTTQRHVALKLLAPGLSEAVRARFLAEGEAEATIRHEHVMPVYDRGRLPDGRPWFVMELVHEPMTLAEVTEALARGAVRPEHMRLRHWAESRALIEEVILPVAEGVAVANEEYETVHRDVKPDNVLVDVRTRRPYLIDFGICHRKGEPVDARRIVGTPRFLSPEQAAGHVDDRTDVFGLGALLHFVLTGEPPIAGASSITREERARRVGALAAAEAEARARGDATRAGDLAARRATLEDAAFRTVEDMVRDAREGSYLPLPSTVPAALAAVVRKAMARDPAARYASGHALAADLRAWLAGGRVLALGEAAAATAVMDSARRAVRRHLTRLLLGLGGLAAGLPAGALLAGALSSPPPPGLEQARDDLAALEREPPAFAGPAAADGVLWDLARSRLDGIDARLAGAPEAAEERARLEALRAHVGPTPTEVRFARGGRWVAEDLLRGRRVPIAAGPGAFPPGPYAVTSTDGAAAPAWALLATPERQTLVIDVPPSHPAWLAFVPGGPAEPAAEGAGRPFLVALRPVTQREWAEWLDEMPEEARRAHLPGTGFVAIGGQGRYGPVPGREEAPVLSVRPRDAQAYAEWRSTVEERPLRLATAEEWGRAAAALGRRAPSFVRGPPELARAGDGAFVVVGFDGVLGRASAEAEAHGAGLRLVSPLP